MKTCSTCQNMLPSTFFSPDKKSPTGLHSQCKTCRNKMSRKRYNRIKYSDTCYNCGRFKGRDGGKALCRSCLDIQCRRMKNRYKKMELECLERELTDIPILKDK